MRLSPTLASLTVMICNPNVLATYYSPGLRGLQVATDDFTGVEATNEAPIVNVGFLNYQEEARLEDRIEARAQFNETNDNS